MTLLCAGLLVPSTAKAGEDRQPDGLAPAEYRETAFNSVGEWLERAQATYQVEVAGRLSVPNEPHAAASGSAADEQPGIFGRLWHAIATAMGYVSFWLERAYEAVGATAPELPYAFDQRSPEEIAAVAEARLKAETEWRALEERAEAVAAEAEREAEKTREAAKQAIAGAVPAIRLADAERAQAERRQSELAKRKQELDRQIADGLRKLEAFAEADEAERERIRDAARKAREALEAAQQKLSDAENAAEERRIALAEAETREAEDGARRAEEAKRQTEEAEKAQKAAEAVEKARKAKEDARLAAEAKRQAEEEARRAADAKRRTEEAEKARIAAEAAHKAEEETRVALEAEKVPDPKEGTPAGGETKTANASGSPTLRNSGLEREPLSKTDGNGESAGEPEAAHEHTVAPASASQSAEIETAEAIPPPKKRGSEPHAAASSVPRASAVAETAQRPAAKAGRKAVKTTKVKATKRARKSARATSARATRVRAYRARAVNHRADRPRARSRCKWRKPAYKASYAEKRRARMVKRREASRWSEARPARGEATRVASYAKSGARKVKTVPKRRCLRRIFAAR